MSFINLKLKIVVLFEFGMGQWTGSKLGREYIKAVYCHPAYLTYVQSTSWEMPGWLKHNLESGRNINNLRYANNMIHMAESKEEPPDENERGE